MLKLIECPRDAMQGLNILIPTQDKVDYINQLLRVGFDTLDFGSFVSPKAIPQMADTAEVIEQIDKGDSKTKLLAIVANLKGAIHASNYDIIDYLGYPFSISETFQQRNTNASIEESMERVREIQNMCKESNKQLVIYISMGFGNPYNDPYSPDIVLQWVEKLMKYDISIFSLSDTVGLADPKTIEYLYKKIIPTFPEVEFGAHLHSAPHNWYDRVKAAMENGCMRFDSAIGGYGGCPMAADDLVGNMSTENLISFFQDKLTSDFNMDEFEKSIRKAKEIFPK